MSKQKFDDLATDYDASRPRYPDELFTALSTALPAGRRLRVLDAGAGTGIALEGLVAHLGEQHDYVAVDLSSGMAAIGRAKLGHVDWRVEPVEPALTRYHGELDLVLAAQAYQWFDRPRFVAAAHTALRSGGILAVLQNNRDHASSPFVAAYEDLLERLSPGYSRSYRAFDVAAELAGPFGAADADVSTHVATWHQTCTVDEFVRLASSSTQVQRGVTAHGARMLDEVRALAAAAAHDGDVEMAYRSELYFARRSR
ncbi:MAG TPA: class I SAM-dependent methyltransferase [Cellulomonas sp.]